MCFYSENQLFIRRYQTEKLGQLAGASNCNVCITKQKFMLYGKCMYFFEML